MNIALVGVLTYVGPGGRLSDGKTVSQMVRLVSAGCFVASFVLTFVYVAVERCHNSRVAAEDPYAWAGVERVGEEERAEVLRTFAGDQQRTDKYHFALAVEDVYKINLETCRQPFENIMSTFQPDQEASTPYLGKKMLYHGANSVAAKGIVTTGFKLPESVCPRMYGPGIYFADVPQKAWTFTTDQRYIVVCDVALGHAKHLKYASSSFNHKILRQRSLRGSSYDSVLGCDQELGGSLREKEYVVYDTAQALPRYLLRVRESTLTVL